MKWTLAMITMLKYERKIVRKLRSKNRAYYGTFALIFQFVCSYFYETDFSHDNDATNRNVIL